jgi:hypothetical protein
VGAAQELPRELLRERSFGLRFLTAGKRTSNKHAANSHASCPGPYDS